MRTPIIETEFTEFGLWLPRNCRDSNVNHRHRDGRWGGLGITNLDYVLEDYRGQHKIMCIEEKRRNGNLSTCQRKTFRVLDKALRIGLERTCYEYWGFFLVQFSGDGPETSNTIRINGIEASVTDLRRHCDFEDKFCHSLFEATVETHQATLFA